MNQDTTLTPRQLPSSQSNDNYALAQWGSKYIQFLHKYPTKDRALHVPSLDDAARRGGKALVSMDKFFGEGSCIYWLKAQLIEVFEYLGLFKTVTEYQLRTLAEHIKARYYYLTPAELMVFFTKFEDGEYALFRSQTVNPQMMMVSFPHFIADVQEARAQAEREANNKKAEDDKQKWLSSPHHSIEDNKKRLESVRNQVNQSNSVNTALYGERKQETDK